MDLRRLAEADLATTLEDAATGFGWPVKVINPAGDELELSAQSGDISELIDPDTGLGVSGRFAHAALRIKTLYDASFELPAEVHDSASKPWLIKFNDINGKEYTFKVAESNPDRTLGLHVCKLEFYEELAP